MSIMKKTNLKGKKCPISIKVKPYPPNKCNYMESWKNKQNVYINKKTTIKILTGGRNEKI